MYGTIKNYLSGILKDTKFQGKTYLVGGCVRDFLRGVSPKDIDLVVELPGGGIGLGEWLWKEGYLLHPPVVYEGFGTTQFRLQEFPGVELEAVQTRSEEYIDRGTRNPRTGYGDLSSDWARRDFTINSLYHGLWDEAPTDPSGHGVEDLQAGVIRTTSSPETIFYDDPLRILRAIRFSVTLGFKILPEVMEGMKTMSPRLRILSKERVVSEVTKILLSADPSRGMRLLGDLGEWGLACISRDLERTRWVKQNKYHIGTVWEHTLAVIGRLQGCDLETLWAGLFHDIGKESVRTVDEEGKTHFLGHAEVGGEMVKDILRTLHFSTGLIKDISELVTHHMDFKGSLRPKDKKLRKLQYTLGRDQYYRLWNLIEADNLSHAQGYCIIGQREYVLSRPSDMFEYQLPVSGEDIMRVRGIGPGPLVGRYLDHLLKIAYSNPGATKEYLLRHLKNLNPGKLGKS